MPTISVRLLAGRSDEQKRDFTRAVTEAAVRILQADESVVRVLFTDVPRPGDPPTARPRDDHAGGRLPPGPRGSGPRDAVTIADERDVS